MNQLKILPFLGNVLNKFWDFVKPYIPEKVKNKTEELAKNFIDRYKKANEPKNKPNQSKSKKRLREGGSKVKNKKAERRRINYQRNYRENSKMAYLKQHSIDGKKGYTIGEFMRKIKPKVIDIINKDKKPKKVKVILSSKFVKSPLQNNQITEEVEKYFGNQTKNNYRGK